MIDEGWCKLEVLTVTLSWSLENGVIRDYGSSKMSLWLARFILPVLSWSSQCTLMGILTVHWMKNGADNDQRLRQISKLIDYSFLLEVNI